MQSTIAHRQTLAQQLQVARVEAVALLGADVLGVADAELRIGGIVRQGSTELELAVVVEA